MHDPAKALSPICDQSICANVSGGRMPPPVVVAPPMTERQELEYLMAENKRLKAQVAQAAAASRAAKLAADADSARYAECEERRREEGEAIGEWNKCFRRASSWWGSLNFRKRLALGSMPSAWEVLGPHRRADRSRPNPDIIPWSLLDRIEGALLQRATEDGKEGMPFIYVRNPPRHGKTFFLDALFGADKREHADVLKIQISYNLLNEDEKTTPVAAQQHFWTRVAKRLLAQLSDDKVHPPRAMLSEWDSIARACPGIDDVPVVICVDELSNLLKYQTWKDGGVRSFFWSLVRFQRVHMFMGQPMRRLVMTGFDHTPACGTAGSSLRCITYAIRPLRYCEAQRLAQRLLYAYAKDDLPFPAALFWLVQTSPGLLGEWAHVAFEHSVATKAPRSVAEFDALIASWCGELMDDLLPRRLQLVERFMCGCICRHCLAAAMDLGIVVPRDGTTNDPFSCRPCDCPCDFPVSTNELGRFTLVPYALHVLMRDFPSLRHGSDTAILKQLKQVFVVLYELGTTGGGRQEEVLRRLRLEAEAAGWSSLNSNPSRDASARAAKLWVADPPPGVGARAGAGECFQRFVASAVRLSALCKLEAKRRRNRRTEITVGDLFPCLPEQATSCLLNHGGALTVIEATDERTLRAMLTGCACDVFPVSVDDIIAKGDLIQRLAALRAHVTLVEKHEAVGFGVDVGHLRTQVEQISRLTGPDGWRGQDAGILGVDATCTESLKRSGAFARAADILAEAEASLGGHTVRTGGSRDCNPIVEQLRDAVFALRVETQRPASPNVQHHYDAALRFAEGADGLALLAGSDAALVPNVWVEAFTAEKTTPPAGATSGTSSSSSLDAAINELAATPCGTLPQNDPQQPLLLLPRRLLGARLLTWVLEHALSTPPSDCGESNSPSSSSSDGADEADPRPSALDVVFCRGDDAPEVLQQQDAFSHPFPCCASTEAQNVKSAFLELCQSKPKSFLLCLSGDSSAGGCSVIAVGESPSRPTEKRPVVLVEVKYRGAAAVAERRKTEALVVGEGLDAEDAAQNRVCSLVNDAELRQMFDFSLVFAGCAM